MQAALTIGALAREAGVPVSTVRYYERVGLLAAPERTESGYRQYGAAELERLRLVRLAQSVGFTLDDAALLLRLSADGPAPPAELDALIRARLERIEAQLAQLTEIRCVLEAALARSADGCVCDKCDDAALLHEKIGADFAPTP